MRALLLGLLLLACTACVDKKKSDEQSAPPPTGSTSGPLTVQQCEAILVDGEKQLAELRAQMSKECTVDAECAVTFATVCMPGCPDYPMSKSASMMYSFKRDEIDSYTCKRWRDSDCEKITPKPKPSCTAMKGVCQNKVCVALTK